MGVFQRALQALKPTASRFTGKSPLGSLLPRCLSSSSASPPEGELLKTELWGFHVEQGAKMVDFSGWSMPLQYKDTVVESVNNVRSNAGVFDVSHMCGHVMKGRDAVKFLETLVVADVQALPAGKSTLTVFTNEAGGIIDDSVITRVSEDELYIVTNAGCREKDIAHIAKHIEGFKKSGGQVDWRVYDERSLLALQGPIAAQVLQKLVSDIDLSKVYFSDFVETNVKGIPCFITRTGYTGEDGFEISIPTEKVVELATALIEDPRVKMAGLGARDALRLEAGLCLYGNDLDETITPVEGGLTWTVAKSRRETGGFLGADVILKQIKDGVDKRRVGLISQGAPARSHSMILDPESGKEIGEVTSGAFSPTLKCNVAMGYVSKAFAKSGTPIQVQVRSKLNAGQVTKMPFVPAKYYKGE